MIAIKDMEMPKNCASCVMRVGKCKERIFMENRPDRCPLIEINTDGDTISRAEAIETVKFECGEWQGLAQTIVNGLKKLSPKQSEKIPYKKPEIIHCGDCRWYEKSHYCGANYPAPDDFCSWAERRNDG